MLRVLLVDDHAVFRTSFRLLLEAEPDLEVVGEAADGRAAVEKCDPTWWSWTFG